MKLWVATTPEQTRAVAAWVAARIPAMRGMPFGPCSAMAVFNTQGDPVAGIVFHDEMPQYRSVGMSIAADSPKWLSKPIISGIMAYPFTQLGAGRITAITAPRESAASIWRFLLKFGFSQEGRVRKGLGDADAIVWGLLASEWGISRFNVSRKVEVKKRRRRRKTNGAHPQLVH